MMKIIEKITTLIEKIKDWFRYSIFSNIYYFLYNHLIRKPHLVDSGLDCHYHDVSELTYATMFQLIVRYIEKEKAFERIDWNDTEKTKETKKSLEKIYYFIKIRLPKLRKLSKRCLKEKHMFFTVCIKLHLNILTYPQKNRMKKRENLWKYLNVKIEEEINENLFEIIKIRTQLWT